MRKRIHLINPDRLALRIALILLALAAFLSTAGGVLAVVVVGVDQMVGAAGVAVSVGLWVVCAEVKQIGDES